MDVDEFLQSLELPDVAVDADDALARTVRRGRARRQRRVAMVGAGAAFGVAGAVAITAAIAGRDRPAGVSTAPSGGADRTTVTASVASELGPGDPAAWRLEPDARPPASASTFMALVTRIGCHGGVTGIVLPPSVVIGDVDIVVTFTVAPEAGSGEFTCQGNDVVAYEVDLGVPLGNRSLVDGACLGDGGAGGTSFCIEDGGVRWPAAAVPAPHECDAASDSVLDVAHEPDWRQYAEYVPWTDVDGCLVRIDVLGERPGPDHCGWQDAQVLIVGRPLGARYTSPADTVEFVRDPAGVFGPEFAAGFDADASLPAGAVDSGYRRGDVALWHVPGDQTAIWLVSPDDVERWPAGTPPLCS
jgi:hypothetical protein